MLQVHLVLSTGNPCARATLRTVGPFALLCLLLMPCAASASKLDSIRSETRGSDSSSQGDRDSDDHDDDDDGVLGSLLWALFGPNEDETNSYDRDASSARSSVEHESLWFTAYPYADGVEGNLFTVPPAPHGSVNLHPITCPEDDPRCMRVENVESCVDGICYKLVGDAPEAPVIRDHRRRYSTRLSLFGHGGTDFDGLSQGKAGIWYEGTHPFGVETRWTWLHERVDDRRDNLVFGQAGLLLRLASGPEIQLHMGAGGQLLVDPGKDTNVGGFNGVVATEIYPMAPVVFRLRSDIGNLGRAFFASGEGSFGAVLGRFEPYVGATGMVIGQVGIWAPVVGMRLHL